MPIDTGDLTKKTYDAIIVAAERFNHDLTLAFGMLSYECDDEKMFIRESEKLARQMLEYDEYDIDDLFFGNPPPHADFIKAVEKILANIAKLKK
ncbi:MAG TPA: hypothetical protein VKZ68_03025 [Ohtaekwangia sp.]|nr:hypothetical protein [Ohtaekwangia sp.]